MYRFLKKKKKRKRCTSSYKITQRVRVKYPWNSTTEKTRTLKLTERWEKGNRTNCTQYTQSFCSSWKFRLSFSSLAVTSWPTKQNVIFCIKRTKQSRAKFLLENLVETSLPKSENAQKSAVYFYQLPSIFQKNIVTSRWYITTHQGHGITCFFVNQRGLITLSNG